MRLVPAAFARLLGRRDFRWLSLGAVASTAGLVGEQVALGWLALELTDSPLLVGVAMGLRMAPLLLAGIPAGILADRGDRVRLLQAAGVAMSAAAGLCGVLTAFGLIAFWHLLLLTFAVGCARALEQTARQRAAHDAAGEGGLVEALALVGLATRLGGLAGSLAAGALIARRGAGVAYLVVAGTYLLGAVAVSPMGRATRPPAAEGPASLREGLGGFLGALRRHPVLPALMALTAGAEILGFSHQAVLPSLARDVLRVGPGGLGVMTASRQVGGLLGILLVPRLGQLARPGAAFLGVLLVFGVAIALLGLMPTFLGVLAVLVIVNAMGAVGDVLSQSLMQLAVPRELRGRASGAWVVAIGTAPAGQIQVGALASAFGVGAALGLHGLALVAVTAAVALLAPRLRRL